MLMSLFLVTTWVGYTITRVTYRRQDIIIIVHGPHFWKSLDLTMSIWQLLTVTSVRCTAGELGNLGRVHHNQGHLKKARDCYNRARAIFLKKLGPYHVHVATTYSTLSQVHCELGNLDRAEDYCHRAFVILHKTELGSRYVDVANFHNNLNAYTERMYKTGWPESWKSLITVTVRWHLT